jgi:hypothetical protein
MAGDPIDRICVTRREGGAVIWPRRTAACHKPTMDSEYRIVPCRHKYWIEARAPAGSYRRSARFDSEDEAVHRLHVLRHQAELAERRATAVPPKAMLTAGFLRKRTE